jgi:hypothetical protein
MTTRRVTVKLWRRLSYSRYSTKLLLEGRTLYPTVHKIQYAVKQMTSEGASKRGCRPQNDAYDLQLDMMDICLLLLSQFRTDVYRIGTFIECHAAAIRSLINLHRIVSPVSAYLDCCRKSN